MDQWLGSGQITARGLFNAGNVETTEPSAWKGLKIWKVSVVEGALQPREGVNQDVIFTHVIMLKSA